MQMNIDDVVEALCPAKERDKCSTLLIGASCSATAGIPTATQFVDIIKTVYPRSYERATRKDYPNCMAELSLAERRDLIASRIDKSKINWSHIGIAKLIKHGYVDRVLTTNFDQLVVKSCAMINIFPAVYDFASSQLFKQADVPDQAIYYLHGQRTGFELMNIKDECHNLSKHLTPVFEDAGTQRVWLVAGYSGECDLVFEHLAKVERFDNRLYWVGYPAFGCSRFC
jgi:NAD-dependent SIR2 family protein deacetylase